MNDTVLLDTTDGVATITLNRPDRLNAINLELIGALTETIDSIATDDAVRAVVLTGAGRGFCAGGDLSPGRPRGDTMSEADLDATMRITQRINAMPKVSIAAVNGPAAGAGLSLACGCDLRYAARSAVFVSAFLRAGQPGDHGAAWWLTRIVGGAKTREIMLLGDRIDANEAARIGLVSSVVHDEDLLPHTTAIARSLAAAPPLALAAMKANLQDAAELPLSEYLDREIPRFKERSASDEARAAAQQALGRR